MRSVSRCSRTGTGSPATCTTWSSSGCTPPACPWRAWPCGWASRTTGDGGAAPWMPPRGARPADAGEHLVGALREALSNAARHASASKVEVTVEAGPELVLLVRDNGVGIGDTRRRSGLANLTERAALLGGTMRAGPAEGGGTELEWRGAAAAAR